MFAESSSRGGELYDGNRDPDDFGGVALHLYDRYGHGCNFGGLPMRGRIAAAILFAVVSFAALSARAQLVLPGASGGSGGGGSGTVTSVSVVTANGISGSVANPTTTPAITVTLGAITPSSVAIGMGSAITSSGPGGVLGTGAFAAAAPCSAFGTASGTCAQGGVITAGGPTGSATVAPVITYNAAGQLTAVSSATITPAVGSITGLGTNVATALGQALNGSGAISATTSPTFVTPALGAAIGTSLALNGATLGSFIEATTGPSYELGTNETATFTGYAQGTTNNSTFVMQRNGSTTAAVPFFGGYFDTEYTGTSTTASLVSLEADATVPSSSSTNVAAIDAFTSSATYSGTAIAALAQGSFAFVQNKSASGTITAAQALQAAITNNNGGTITTADGIQIKQPKGGASSVWTTINGIEIQNQNPSGTNTVTNPPIALLIDSQTGSGAYAIQQNGSGINAFAGRSTFGSATAAAGQSGDVAQIKETDAAAAPGAGYAVLKWVAGSGTSCNLIAYAGTSATPVTIASTVGSGC
jgi:hypothetical protein